MPTDDELPTTRPPSTAPAAANPAPADARQDAAAGSGASAGEAFPAEPLPATAFPKVVAFTALARCGDEVWIENGGQIYRLRRTRQGKLILTK